MHMNRRSFITRSGLALGGSAAPLILPTPVFSQNAVKPSNQITMGCIGVGGMGSGNMRSFLRERDCRVVAVCDVDRRKAEGARDRVNGHYKNQDCKIYSDYRELIARTDIDAIMLATPDHWHGPIAVAAAKSGKDIYGEKPIAHSLGEGRAVANAMRDYGRIWQTGSWQRSHSNFHQACEIIRNGWIGRVRQIDVGIPMNGRSGSITAPRPGPVPEGLDYDMYVGPAPWFPYDPGIVHFHWRWNLRFGGGNLQDWAGHHIDIAHWGMGWDESGPVEVEGQGNYTSGGIYDCDNKFLVHSRYADNTVMRIGGNAKGIRTGTRWIGDDGWIQVDRGHLSASSPDLLKQTPGASDIRLTKSPGHHREFLNCIKDRSPTLTPAETAHRSVAPGHLGHAAMKLGRKLVWDPVKEEVANDPAAMAMLWPSLSAPWHV